MAGTTEDKLMAIWNHYGPQVQAKQLVEEAYELVEAINEVRSGEAQGVGHITEEVADVLVLIDQVCIAHGIEADKVKLVKHRKAALMLERIDSEVR